MKLNKISLIPPDFTLNPFSVCLRYLKEQDQLPSSAQRQEHEEPPEGEAERLQPPHHHLPTPHQQQHHLPTALLRQHHNPLVSDALAGVHRRWSPPRQPRHEQLPHKAPRRPQAADASRSLVSGHLPGDQWGDSDALEVRDSQRRQRV